LNTFRYNFLFSFSYNSFQLNSIELNDQDLFCLDSSILLLILYISLLYIYFFHTSLYIYTLYLLQYFITLTDFYWVDSRGLTFIYLSSYTMKTLLIHKLYHWLIIYIYIKPSLILYMTITSLLTEKDENLRWKCSALPLTLYRSL
jgi:hypothetical protein